MTPRTLELVNELFHYYAVTPDLFNHKFEIIIDFIKSFQIIFFQIVEPTDICEMNVDPGNCDQPTLLFYYNKQTATCEQFYYNGCDGNDNKFTSEEQCQRRCGEFRGVNVCELPKDVGPCDEQHPRYYFDREHNRCLPFEYTGCEGNGNRFIDEDECNGHCPPIDVRVDGEDEGEDKEEEDHRQGKHIGHFSNLTMRFFNEFFLRYKKFVRCIRTVAIAKCPATM